MIIFLTIAICVLLALLYYYLIYLPRVYKRMPIMLQEEEDACIARADEELRKCKKIWQIESSFANSQNKSSAKTIVNLKECLLPIAQKFIFAKVADLNIPMSTEWLVAVK